MLRALATMILLALAGTAGPALALCRGPGLLERLDAQERAALDARVADMPFAQGLFWQAERDGQVVTLVGTMHVHDPRLDAVLARATPLLDEAALLLVEITPEGQARMQEALAQDPSRMYLTDGPTLPELLDEATWATLAEAARARGIPPFLAAKARPWFLMLSLSVPACAAGHLAGGGQGLDIRLMEAAQERGLPMAALEPWDAVFAMFEDSPMDEQLGFLRMGVLDAALQEEMFVSLLDGYFAGEVGQVWELGRLALMDLPGVTAAEAEALFAATEERLLTTRNRAWIPVIEEAAARHGRVTVAAGAAHLPGREGVLALLEARGWTVTPLP